MRQSYDQYVLRFPDGLRPALKERAARNRRSLNAEMILILERAVEADGEMAVAGEKFADRTPATAASPVGASNASQFQTQHKGC